MVADKNASPVLVVVEGTKQNYLPELSEVKGIVTSDYQEKLDLDWIKQLRIKYLIDINWAVLKTLIKE